METTGADLALIGTLKEVHEARRRKSADGKVSDKLSAPIKAWLEAHPGEDMYDGESGISAWLTAATMQTWDVRTMVFRDPELVTALAHMGLLTVQTTPFNSLLKSAPNDDLVKATDYRATTEQLRLNVGDKEDE
jgi:hypothetical protein